MKRFKAFGLIKYFLLVALLFAQLPLIAQQVNPPPTDDGNKSSGGHFITALESNLSILVLIFGIITIFLEVYLIRTNKIDSGNALKFIVVTLIITGTLFLITAGYESQISPALGLLGTIAGYLLGKTEQPSNTQQTDNKDKS